MKNRPSTDFNHTFLLRDSPCSMYSVYYKISSWTYLNIWFCSGNSKKLVRDTSQSKVLDFIELTQQVIFTVWAGCGPAQSPPRCTKCNIPPINSQCINLILFNVALRPGPHWRHSRIWHGRFCWFRQSRQRWICSTLARVLIVDRDKLSNSTSSPVCYRA